MHTARLLCRRTCQEDPGGGAGAQHAAEELGESIRDWQDGGEASHGSHVQAERLVLQHGGRCEGQGVPGEVEAGISATHSGVQAIPWGGGFCTTTEAAAQEGLVHDHMQSDIQGIVRQILVLSRC